MAVRYGSKEGEGMLREDQAKKRVRDAGDSLARTSNNAFAKERDKKAKEWVGEHPSVSRHLVDAGVYPNDVKARQRLNRLATRGLVRVVGLVNLTGFDEKLWASFAVNKPQHEAELTELVLRLLRLKPKGIRRGVLVDGLLADLEIDFDDTIYFEHDRSTLGYSELLARVKGYSDCGRDVLWSMYSHTRINGIIAYARKHSYEIPPSVWFTTFEKALANVAGPWTNIDGEQTTL